MSSKPELPALCRLSSRVAGT